MKRPILYLCALTFICFSCKENPVSPSQHGGPVSLSAGRFNGNWLYISTLIDSLKLSFDSTSFRFVNQMGIDQFNRDFYGSFFVADSFVALSYDIGFSRAYYYSFSSDTLFLNDTLYKGSPPLKYLRTSKTSSPNGWSTKLAISWQHTYSTARYISATAFSDSTPLALVDSFLVQIDTAIGFVKTKVIHNTPALDAVGRHVWYVTDSTIQQRELNDSTMIFSFPYRNVVASNLHVTGFAVNADYCLLAASDANTGKGMLFRFSVGGVFQGAIQAYSGIKDLCFANGRLFCVEGSETFYELDANTARPITCFNVIGRPLTNNFDGIAYSNGFLQLADHLRDTFRLTNVAIP